MALETVLFDLDGTIIDTEPAAARAVLESFREWGIALKNEDANFVTGRTWEVAFQFFFSKYKIPIARAQAEKLMLDRYHANLEHELPIVAGSVDAVKALSKDFRLALISGSYRRQIQWALEKLKIASHFQFVLGAEDYPASKPAPDGYRTALERLRVEARNSIVFEDSEAGILSGVAAGSWVVAITGTNHHGQDVSRAHHRITDLVGVNPRWIRELHEKFLKDGK